MAEDTLAQILESATTDPSQRAPFRQALVNATIYVMGEIEGQDPAKSPQTMLKPGQKIILRSQKKPDGRTMVPFFSSLEKLEGFIQGKDKVNCLAIPARTLFDLANGSTLVLNPGSRVKGEFTPDDIAKILQMTGTPASTRTQ
ncbi:MAG TPA: SseB family protein [Hyphomonadaceae bacterium]|jgi:hypothetical protein|nr:SseB family protein [Hyphomonadaceae bacterium]